MIPSPRTPGRVYVINLNFLNISLINHQYPRNPNLNHPLVPSTQAPSLPPSSTLPAIVAQWELFSMKPLYMRSLRIPKTPRPISRSPCVTPRRVSSPPGNKFLSTLRISLAPWMPFRFKFVLDRQIPFYRLSSSHPGDPFLPFSDSMSLISTLSTLSPFWCPWSCDPLILDHGRTLSGYPTEQSRTVAAVALCDPHLSYLSRICIWAYTR